MSLFTRLWNFIRRPTGYVGKDLQGNYFYEYASRSGGRSRRVMKYKGQTDTLAIAERSRLLAVQWKSWLTHTRPQPPTLEELQADMIRQERLRQNVAIIEAREREERLRLAATSQHDYENDRTEHQRLPYSNGSESTTRGTPNRKQYDHNPWVPPPASDEPQPWTPRAIRRGE